MPDELPPHSVDSIKLADKEAASVISKPGPSEYLQRNWKIHLCTRVKKGEKKKVKQNINK